MSPNPVSPEKACYELLGVMPVTEMERKLQAVLNAATIKTSQQKKQIVAMQSAAVLYGAYCELVHRQLAAQEESKKRKQKGHLVGDGLPCLLLSWKFVAHVVEFHNNVMAAAEAVKKWKASWEERTEAMNEWKVLERKRKAENVKIRAQWKVDVKVWEKEWDLAKGEKWRTQWNKPVLKGLLFSPVPKPQVSVEDDVDDVQEKSGSDSSSSSSNDSDEDSD